MSTVTSSRPDLRVVLRRPGDALPGASIGTVPIIWNNVDVVELRHGTDADTILDEIARVGYEGTQLGIGFPEGPALRVALRSRHLRLAEVYLSFPATVDGPSDDAVTIAQERVRLLRDGGGEVLSVALDASPGREAWAARAARPEAPVLTEAGWDALIRLLHEIADLRGAPIAFHPHAGTFIETPAEVERLASLTDPARVQFCLDVGHYLVGGGDPVGALTRFGERVTHIHLKDVDPTVLGGLQAGRLGGFSAAIRARLFTELGAGSLDLDGVIEALAARDYAGWLMVEQDSGWGPPSESAAIGRRVLAASLRRVGITSKGVAA